MSPAQNLNEGSQRSRKEEFPRQLLLDYLRLYHKPEQSRLETKTRKHMATIKLADKATISLAEISKQSHNRPDFKQIEQTVRLVEPRPGPGAASAHLITLMTW